MKRNKTLCQVTSGRANGQTSKKVNNETHSRARTHTTGTLQTIILHLEAIKCFFMLSEFFILNHSTILFFFIFSFFKF